MRQGSAAFRQWVPNQPALSDISTELQEFAEKVEAKYTSEMRRIEEANPHKHARLQEVLDSKTCLFKLPAGHWAKWFMGERGIRHTYDKIEPRMDPRQLQPTAAEIEWMKEDPERCMRSIIEQVSIFLFPLYVHDRLLCLCCSDRRLIWRRKDRRPEKEKKGPTPRKLLTNS